MEENLNEDDSDPYNAVCGLKWGCLCHDNQCWPLILLEMASKKRVSVNKDDESGSKKQKNSGAVSEINELLQSNDEGGFYTNVTVTEQELEQLSSGKPIPPPKADENDLFKLNTAVPGKMIRNFVCGSCRSRNYHLSKNDDNFKPHVVKDPVGWIRFYRDVCKNCSAYNNRINQLVSEGWEDSYDENADNGYKPLPPSMPGETMYWTLTYSIVSAGVYVIPECAACEEHNRELVRKLPPIYLVDGWVRLMHEICPTCFRYHAAIVKVIREGWPSRYQFEREERQENKNHKQ